VGVSDPLLLADGFSANSFFQKRICPLMGGFGRDTMRAARRYAGDAKLRPFRVMPWAQMRWGLRATFYLKSGERSLSILA